MGQVTDRSIRKTDIIPLVVKAWSRAMTAKNVKAGFKRSGIYPFDPPRHTKKMKLNISSPSPAFLSSSHLLRRSSPPLSPFPPSPPPCHWSPPPPKGGVWRVWEVGEEEGCEAYSQYEEGAVDDG